MKLKKVLTVFLTVVMLLTLSSSVYATDVSPTAIGIGDSRETAITMFDNEMYSLYISGPNDYDWYKWTNNTGKDIIWDVTLYPTATGTSLNLAAIVVYPGGLETSLLHGQRNYPSNGMKIHNLYVPPGSSVYVRIGNDNSDTVQYRTNMVASPRDF
ncbi:hypothetical protein FHR92_003539 [Fontibacillus solani]|uniref:Uncharacterized protein n=1 Tax=Fontibacillus solani TaxID=1572857 RepID=A0A7W3SVS0_9BACL|nr:hypothetical protein [Fontibacillus solani]MBA9087059.1 hypothetical protein [Fontibacillus solani]